ncbi:FAD-binding domain-containing protein [Bosea sp. AAP35]|uniref:FAD-binding domain-containing protein n=1 Tax=Bosea sp. AAP35 TaxID=1523417 RepID=UPI000A4948B2|nr:FAD-binding domain-containing protein [Bosea sp. AAP35]
MPMATRETGLAMLAEFVPRMGRRYANGRNFDHGPGRHDAVSRLSPYIRRRLVTEAELVSAAIAAHGPEEAEKFVEEVLWRGYFKGWLERRPSIWSAYVTGLEADLAVLDADRRLRRRVSEAEEGRTGLACFDAWAQELTETGYLHNHARMWFASIWIFTLGLPWRLGADFFYRHLLDGDPASNTLGWRWVAGLHTRGKPYPAQAWNIAKFTGQRFTPRDSDLAEVTQGLEAQEPDGLPPAQAARSVRAPEPGLPTALLITEEDCRLEDFNLAGLDIRACATLSASHLRSPLPVSDAVAAFEARALDDAAARVGLAVDSLQADAPDNLVTWAARSGARQIATPYVTQGPLHDFLAQAQPLLAARSIALCEFRREWDGLIWPHASAGFFKVKQQIPQILGRLRCQ